MAQSRWPCVGDSFDSVKSFRGAAFAQADRDGVELIAPSSCGLVCWLKQHYAGTETGTGPRCSFELKTTVREGAILVTYAQLKHDCSSRIRHARAINGKTVQYTRKRCLEYPHGIAYNAGPPRKRQKLGRSGTKSSVQATASSASSLTLERAHEGGEPSIGDTFSDKASLIATLNTYASERDFWLYQRESAKDRVTTFNCRHGDGRGPVPNSQACPFVFKAMAQRDGSWRITTAALQHSHSLSPAVSRSSYTTSRRPAQDLSGDAPFADDFPSTPKQLLLPVPAHEWASPSPHLFFTQSTYSTPAQPQPAEPDSLAAFFHALPPALPPSTVEDGLRQLGEIGIEGTADLVRFATVNPARRQHLLDSLQSDKAVARVLLERFGGF